jgi:hypothetical protein
MVWWGGVQGGNRCSELAVCQMRSRLSADMAPFRFWAYRLAQGLSSRTRHRGE